MSNVALLPSDEPPPVKHTFTTAKFEAVNAPTATPAPGAHLPIDGGASGMGILPMSEGLTQTHGQDARATAGIQMLPSIGRCPPTPAPTDVYQVLRDNLARENAAGLNVVKPVPPRRSRRRRDFWLVLIGGNLAIMASVGFTSINVMTVIYGFAGVILLSSGLIWIMWFVMDDY
jgi:hypothetical protein